MGTAEKVAKCGVTREGGWLYYIDKQGNIARSRMVRGGQKATSQDRIEIVASPGITRDDNYIYFMDDDGDVARVPRSKAGKARPITRPIPKVNITHDEGDEPEDDF